MPGDSQFLPDEHLMKGVQNGRQAEFELLYSRYAQRMLGYFYRMFNGDEEKAQDFLQDLFIKVLEKASLFDTNQNFEAWIFTIASNMCKNEYRKLNHHQTFSQQVNGQEGIEFRMDSKIDFENYQLAVFQLVERLEPDKKELFILRFEEELSIEEIANILKLKEGTVKSRLFYLKKFLAEKLKVYDPKTNG